MKTKSARIHELVVSVCGVSELPDFAGKGVTHVVSIWDPDEAENPEPRLRISKFFPAARAHFEFFNDIVEGFGGGTPPSRTSVRDLLNFTERLEAGEHLLVHCAAGISRSTAVALATLCQHAEPGHEMVCFHALKRIRPLAHPNPLIVQFADDLLGRGGAIIEAAKSGVDCEAEAADCRLPRRDKEPVPILRPFRLHTTTFPAESLDQG